MSVSGSSAGHGSQYAVDPLGLELNASRLSTYSKNSNISGVVLGGVEYPVGSRVGKSGTFVIGDPALFEPYKSFESVRSGYESHGSQKAIVEAQPIEEKGFRFEDWNWQPIRLGCFIFYIGVAVEHKLSCEATYKWWQGSVFYSIPVAYFRDVDDPVDNIGDILGLHEKLDYVEYMDFEVISLSHLLASDQSFWESYTSFTNVDVRLGTLADFGTMMDRANRLSLKVLMEISPYYTSKEHDWFQHSSGRVWSSDVKYEEYYVWTDQPDSEDVDFFEYDERYRNMYYRHDGNANKPLLLWSNHELQEEFEAVLRFWLERGVDGFIMRDMHKMYVHHHADLTPVLKSWRNILDDHSKGDKILVLEEKFLNAVAQHDSALAHSFAKRADLVEVELAMGSNATYSLLNRINTGYRYTKKVDGPWTCWKLTNMARVDALYRTSLQMLQLMLPGTPLMIAGQETGNNYMDEASSTVASLTVTPMLWRNDDVVPYRASGPQNSTTLRALRKLIDERQSAVALRHDSIYESDGDKNKDFNFEFRHLNYKWMLLERTYRRKNAYYFAGNFYRHDVEADMLYISTEAEIVADNFDKYKRTKNLADLKLHPAHGVVYKVRH